MSFRRQSYRLVTAQGRPDKVQKETRHHDIVGDALEEAKVGFARTGFEPQPVSDKVETNGYRHGDRNG